jgi:hypothetical protein
MCTLVKEKYKRSQVQELYSDMGVQMYYSGSVQGYRRSTVLQVCRSNTGVRVYRSIITVQL